MASCLLRCRGCRNHYLQSPRPELGAELVPWAGGATSQSFLVRYATGLVTLVRCVKVADRETFIVEQGGLLYSTPGGHSRGSHYPTAGSSGPLVLSWWRLRESLDHDKHARTNRY